VSLSHVPVTCSGHPSAASASCSAATTTTEELGEAEDVFASARHVDWSNLPLLGNAAVIWNCDMLAAKPGENKPSGAKEGAPSAAATSRCATRIVAEFILQPSHSRGKAHWEYGPLGRSKAGAKVDVCAATAAVLPDCAAAAFKTATMARRIASDMLDGLRKALCAKLFALGSLRLALCAGVAAGGQGGGGVPV
jgi:hypothetical protein